VLGNRISKFFFFRERSQERARDGEEKYEKTEAEEENESKEVKND